jgi:hypothetical protein
MKLLIALVILLSPLAATAQEEHEFAARRGVMERDQQSAEFALRLRQSQQQMDLESAVWQLRRQQWLHDEQLRRPAQPGDGDIAERERRAQSLRFQGERTWGPVLDEPRRRWTPTLIPEG